MTQQRASLVSPAHLRALLDGSDDVVAAEVAADPQGYYSGHLPGAVLLDWFDDVHDADRRGVVGQARFERLLCERGISPDTHVVLYDDNLSKHAAYAHWLFRYYRHAQVSVLDGGRRAWVASGEPLVLDEPERARTMYSSPAPTPRCGSRGTTCSPRSCTPPRGPSSSTGGRRTCTRAGRAATPTTFPCPACASPGTSRR